MVLLIVSSFALKVDAGYSTNSMAFPSLAVRSINLPHLTGKPSISLHFHLGRKVKVLFCLLYYYLHESKFFFWSNIFNGCHPEPEGFFWRRAFKRDLALPVLIPMA